MKRITKHLLRQSLSSPSSRLSRHAAASHGFQRFARQASTSSVEKAAPSRPVVQPLPNNTPQEDYASPTMYTFGIIGRLFRYSIYASVLIVFGGSALYAAVHAYVEYVALHGRSPLALDEEQQLYYQLDDLLPGYSGAHLGGGTDPGLGWRGRNAARAAWIATHLRRGGVITRVRGQHSDLDIPDSAWLEAERYLLYALQEADKQQADNRLAKRELLLQLAEIRGNMAGARGLAESKRNLQEVILDISEDTTMENSVRAARLLDLETRLAMVDTRIVRELLSGSAGGRTRASAEFGRVMQRLEHSIIRNIHMLGTGPSSHKEQPTLSTTPELSSEPASPASKRSWLSWKDTSNVSEARANSLPMNELVDSLRTISPSISPILHRAIVASCITFIGALAEDKRLDDSLAVAQATQDFMKISTRDTVISSSSTTPEAAQHSLWLHGRQATLDTMMAEIAYTTGAMDGESCTRLLSEAMQECRSCLTSIPDWQVATLLQPAHRLYNLSHNEAAHIRRTGVSAAQLKGVLAEKAERNYKHALECYESALTFISDEADGHVQDQTLLRTNLLEAIRRCRNKLLPLSSS